MILSSTSPYALLKEFSIACGFNHNAVFCRLAMNFVIDCRRKHLNVCDQYQLIQLFVLK